MPELPEVETIARTPHSASRGAAHCGLRAAQPFHFCGDDSARQGCGRRHRPSGTPRQAVAVASCIRLRIRCLLWTRLVRPVPLARCLACGDERITGLGFHLKMTGRLFVYPAAHLRKNIPGSSSTLTTVLASFSTIRANSAMCGFCRLPPFPAGRSGTALARSRWRWTPMPSRLVLPGGGQDQGAAP